MEKKLLMIVKINSYHVDGVEQIVQNGIVIMYKRRIKRSKEGRKIMDKKEGTISDILERFKQLVPNANIKIEPESSLKELLALEKEYSMNTSDAVNLRIVLDEEVYMNEQYHYLYEWESLYRTYKLFKGDESLINTN